MKPARRAEPHTEFFVLRAPLLAFEAFEAWTEGLAAPAACAESDARLEQALAADRALLRAPARRVARRRPGRRRARARLAGSRRRRRPLAREPDTKRGRSAERSLVRYVTRLGVPSRPLRTRGGVPDRAVLAAIARLELPPRSELEVRARVDSGLLRDGGAPRRVTRPSRARSSSCGATPASTASAGACEWPRASRARRRTGSWRCDRRRRSSSRSRRPQTVRRSPRSVAALVAAGAPTPTTHPTLLRPADRAASCSCR